MLTHRQNGGEKTIHLQEEASVAEEEGAHPFNSRPPLCTPFATADVITFAWLLPFYAPILALDVLIFVFVARVADLKGSAKRQIELSRYREFSLTASSEDECSPLISTLRFFQRL